jgi:hypothetical protein
MRPTNGKLTIRDGNGEPIWFADFSNEKITLEFENYGRGSGPDIESFQTIAESEFQKIREYFESPKDYPMRWLFEDLSKSGRGEELKTFLKEKIDLKTDFVWFSFPDE